ncbi:hypothetical protein SDC9_130972 [bioreactor metagenome]|uniref:Uncharacterized protein n=1 Tax=bioreactor metagenome TaxID=1076179 RepID=A0A645D5I9_9ZZZZ
MAELFLNVDEEILSGEVVYIPPPIGAVLSDNKQPVIKKPVILELKNIPPAMVVAVLDVKLQLLILILLKVPPDTVFTVKAPPCPSAVLFIKTELETQTLEA